MFRSSGMRFVAIGILALVMFIPLNLVSGIIEDRARYSDQTIADISREWGGPQLISGPVLVIPVTEEVTYNRQRPLVDPISGIARTDLQGKALFEYFQETVTEDREPVRVYATDLNVDLKSTSDTRHRGIFEVPVYSAEARMDFSFDANQAESALVNDEVLDWEAARVEVSLSSNRALRGEAVMAAGSEQLPLEPIASGEKTGVTADVGDPRALGPLSLNVMLNGAQSFSVAATGRTTRVALVSDWPDPSFYGAFLPDTSEISDDGFTANWTVPHLARALPIVAREDLDERARRSTAMGVRYVTPNDFYQKAYRAARYGILFIGLTFLTILLLDCTSARPAHPVQYLMVGLAQAVFVLLMVAYAEQIGFGAAYALASGATIGLLTVFGATALKLGKRTNVLAAMLITLYGVLYLILRSADFALLAGATLAFAALAGTMILTKDEDWHGPEGERRRWFARRKAPPEPGATPV